MAAKSTFISTVVLLFDEGISSTFSRINRQMSIPQKSASNLLKSHAAVSAAACR